MAEQDSSKALIPPSATTDTFSRRRVITTAATGAALMALGAPAVHAQTKTIRFPNAEPGRESVRALRVAAAEYEKQTGVKVVVDTVPPDDAYSKLQASLSSGTPYDIGTLAFAGHMLILAEAGKLVPMTKLIEKSKWGPRILFPVKGEHYWYPYDYNFCWMYYRKDLYQQKGLFALTWIGIFVKRNTGKARQTRLVLRKVSRNPIDNDADAGLMAGIDKVHEPVGGSEARRRSVKPQRLIAPRAVKGVFAHR